MFALRSMMVLRRLSKSRGTRACLWGSLSMLAAREMKQIFHIIEHKRFQTARLIVFNPL
jgi:hypothetical protein